LVYKRLESNKFRRLRNTVNGYFNFILKALKMLPNVMPYMER